MKHPPKNRVALITLPHPRLLGLSNWETGKYLLTGLPEALLPTSGPRPYTALLRGEGCVLAFGRVYAAVPGRVPRPVFFLIHRVLKHDGINRIMLDVSRFTTYKHMNNIFEEEEDARVATLREVARLVPRIFRPHVTTSSDAWDLHNAPRKRRTRFSRKPILRRFLLSRARRREI